MARRKTLDFAGVAEPVRIGVAARALPGAHSSDPPHEEPPDLQRAT